jgi:hypothetical protein
MAVHLSADGGAAIGGASGPVNPPDAFTTQSVSGSQVLTALGPGAHTVSLGAVNLAGQEMYVGDGSAGASFKSVLIVQVIPN